MANEQQVESKEEKGLQCPQCNSKNTMVAQTHSRAFVGIIRLRKCKDCGTVFYTQERVIRRV